MLKISKEPATGITEKERKGMFAKLGYGLKENKRTGNFAVFKKQPKDRAEFPKSIA